MRQKQSLSGALFVVGFIVLLAFSGLIISRLNFEVNENIQEKGYGLDENQLNIIDDTSTSITGAFDKGVLIALVLAFLIVAITSLLASTNALFFIFGLLYYIISLITVPIAANIYIKAHNLSSMQEVATALPITNVIMGNYVVICGVMTSIVLVLLYMRSRA